MEAGAVLCHRSRVRLPAGMNEAWRGFWRLLAAEALAEVAWYKTSGLYEDRGTRLIESRSDITLLLFY